MLFFLTLWKFRLVKFNLSHRKKTNQRWILDPQLIYDGALCDNTTSGSHFALTKQLQFRWWRNRKVDSVCYYLQFPSENRKHGREGKPEGIKHFTYTYLFPFLGKIIYYFLCWKTVLLWSICILAFLQSVIWINSIILEILE